MPDREPRICVVGATNIDLIAKVRRLATAAAALSVTKIGTQASFPSRAEFDEFAGRVHEDR